MVHFDAILQRSLRDKIHDQLREEHRKCEDEMPPNYNRRSSIDAVVALVPGTITGSYMDRAQSGVELADAVLDISKKINNGGNVTPPYYNLKIRCRYAIAIGKGLVYEFLTVVVPLASIWASATAIPAEGGIGPGIFSSGLIAVYLGILRISKYAKNRKREAIHKHLAKRVKEIYKERTEGLI